MIKKLKNFSLFDGIDESSIDKITQYFSAAQCYEAGQALMEEGGRQDHVYFLLSGKVRLSLMSAEGNSISYRDVEPNDYFGWLSAIDADLRLTSAVATEKTTLLTVSANNFQKVLLSTPQIQKNFLKRIGAVVRRYTERIKELTLYSARQRVLHEFHRLFHERGNPIQIESHEDMATWAGTTRETVTRAIRELEQEGVIERKDNDYYYNAQMAEKNAWLCE